MFFRITEIFHVRTIQNTIFLRPIQPEPGAAGLCGIERLEQFFGVVLCNGGAVIYNVQKCNGFFSAARFSNTDCTTRVFCAI